MKYNERPTGEPCPQCGQPVRQYDWWDDPPEVGGGFLEVVRYCPACDWDSG